MQHFLGKRAEEVIGEAGVTVDLAERLSYALDTQVSTPAQHMLTFLRSPGVRREEAEERDDGRPGPAGGRGGKGAPGGAARELRRSVLAHEGGPGRQSREGALSATKQQEQASMRGLFNSYHVVRHYCQ